MFNKPHDLVWIFGIAALAIVTMGFGIQSVTSGYGVSIGDDISFFHDTNESLTTGDFKKTGDAATESLSGDEGQSSIEALTEFLTQGAQSLKAVGQTYKSVESTMKEGSKILGLDPIYWMTIATAIIITMFVVIYTWIRGS